ncbi:ABC-2 transporter permease [Anaerofustis stercorihominis]|uniref:ABC-2 transporter permease n=1 Tax=Anaerofustis stercorihominis TaxID=214853 RepID=UPI003991C549
MKGIIYKDFFLGFRLTKNLLSWLAAVIMMSLIIIFMKGTFGFIVISGITLPLIGSSLLQVTVEQDELTEFDKIQLTYPMTKKEIILSKYIGGFIVEGVCILINFLLCMLYVYGFKSIPFIDAMYILAAGSVCGLIFFAISYFGFVLLGNKKGLIIYMTMVILISGFYGFTSWNIDYISLVKNNALFIIGIGFLVSILSLIISYFASLKIYTRRYS